MPTIVPILFRNEGATLSGMLHRPDEPGPFPAVLFCHGFTGHKIESGRIFVLTAQRLAEAGIAAFRFDCRGSGESEGDFEAMTISGEVSDAVRALEVLAARPDVDPSHIGVLGFSMGGTVAPLAAQAHGRARSLCLWAPVSHPAQQFQRFTDEMTGDRLDIGQYVVGRAFAEDLANHHPANFVGNWPGPVKVIHGTGDESVTLDSGRAYLSGPGRREMTTVEGADHVWSSSEWQKQLMDATVAWFRETL